MYYFQKVSKTHWENLDEYRIKWFTNKTKGKQASLSAELYRLNGQLKASLKSTVSD